MASPEEKAKRRTRMRRKLIKDLHNPKYRQRVKEDKKKKALENIRGLTHSELVELIQEEDDGS